MVNGAGSSGAFERYLASLVGSWRAMAVPHRDARVATGDGWVAAVFPSHDTLGNAVLLVPGALAEVEAALAGCRSYAVWTLDHAHATAAVLERAGWRRSATTRPMHADLDMPAPAQPYWPVRVVRDVDPAVVTGLNGVGGELLAGVPGARTYATADGASGLVTIDVGDDVNVSFVATAPQARGEGRATALLAAALDDARAAGRRTASLQATPMAERLYARHGFHPVGRWQEWSR